MPERCASRDDICANSNGKAGRPSVAGSSHAMSLYLYDHLWGGNTGGRPGRGRSLQAWQSLMKEPLAPETDHVA